MFAESMIVLTPVLDASQDALSAMRRIFMSTRKSLVLARRALNSTHDGLIHFSGPWAFLPLSPELAAESSQLDDQLVRILRRMDAALESNEVHDARLLEFASRPPQRSAAPEVPLHQLTVGEQRVVKAKLASAALLTLKPHQRLGAFHGSSEVGQLATELVLTVKETHAFLELEPGTRDLIWPRLVERRASIAAYVASDTSVKADYTHNQHPGKSNSVARYLESEVPRVGGSVVGYLLSGGAHA